MNRNNKKDSAFNGAAAGFVSSVLLQPLEVLKTNLILLPDSMKSVRDKNFLVAFAESCKIIYKKEGPQGFFRGLTPAILRSVSAGGIFFSSLHGIEDILSATISNQNAVNFIASATARTMSSFLTNPFVLMKTRAGIIGNDTYRNVYRNFGLIYKQEGLGGFFKGSFAIILRDFPFGGIFYVTYKWSNDILSTYSAHQSMYFISGMVAGIAATGITQPLEIVRAKKMAYTKRIVAGKNEQSILQALKEIK